jgi:hypothetical protein
LRRPRRLLLLHERRTRPRSDRAHARSPVRKGAGLQACLLVGAGLPGAPADPTATRGGGRVLWGESGRERKLMRFAERPKARPWPGAPMRRTTNAA